MNRKNSKNISSVAKRSISILVFVIIFGLLIQPSAFATKGILVVYSGDDETKLIAESIKDSLDCELLEIKDLKDRSGIGGYFSTKFDYWFDRHTQIEPLHPDFASYPIVVIVSPVKKWLLNPAIHTMMDKNSLKDNMVFIVTTSKQNIKRYDSYDDNASFWQKRQRNKIRKWRSKSQKVAQQSGAQIIGHFHITTKGKSDKQLQEMAAQIFSSEGRDLPQWLLKAKNLPLWMLSNGYYGAGE